ncbi:hypothetical protein [Bacillus niameyensis]|uniref:hypothetical protein n=1 Tax=Bacillus niameyensis TaxID=1522308 RepID=UPI000784BDF2|nr:hypothetical protein [Bacillus niameyensis]
MVLSSQSQLILCPLSIQKDKKHYIVEDPSSGDFFEMPKICIDAIEMIDKGEMLGDIEVILKANYPNEEVNMIEFAEQLIDLGLVEEVDGERIRRQERGRSLGGLQWISPKVGQIIFNKVTNKIFILFFLLNVILAVMNPNLIPTYKDIFLFDSMVLNMVTYMAVSFILIIIHEFGHVFAIRAHNLPAKLDIGNRLLFVVFETDLTSAWKLPSRQRNVLYFAGMALEQSLIFIAFTIKILFPESGAIFIGILGIVIFDLFIKTIYQCCFYMKTDVYYFFENVTGCYNLMENGKQYLSKWIPFIKYDPTTAAFQGETKTIRLYSVLYICGILLTFSLFAIYFLPQVFYAYSLIFSNLTDPAGSSSFWDAVVFIGQTILMLGLLFYSVVKKRVKESSL